MPHDPDCNRSAAARTADPAALMGAGDIMVSTRRRLMRLARALNVAPPRPRKRYLQEILFRKALREIGVRVDPEPKVDHHRGRITMGAVTVGLIYPVEWLARISALPGQKHHTYSFVGAVTPEGGREELLRPFAEAGHLILPTTYQRRASKGRFNPRYFSVMRSTRFALCPMHTDWPGPPEYTWTYRFVEAVLCGAIPVCFKEAPLGRRFLRDYEFVWADEPSTHVYSTAVARRNLSRALRAHFLPADAAATWLVLGSEPEPGAAAGDG